MTNYHCINIKAILLFFLQICCIGFVFSQNEQSDSKLKNNWLIEGGVRYGMLSAYTSDTYLKGTEVFGGDLWLGKQTTGQKEWEQWFDYPSYGLMLRFGAFNNPMLKWKAAALGYLNGHIFRRSFFSLNYEFGGGLVFFPHPYDSVTNPRNRFIGTPISAHFNMALSANFKITKQLDLKSMIVFSHSSNGAMRLPNIGVNMASGELGLRYYVKNRPQYIKTIDTIRRFSPINTLYFYAAPSFKQSRHDYFPDSYSNDTYYFTSTLQFGFMRQGHPIFRYGMGVEVFYNASMNAGLPDSLKSVQNCIAPGIYAGMELLYNRFVVHAGLGVYVYHPTKQYEPVYERFGCKVLLGKSRKHFVGVTIKAHNVTADYFEWMYGYEFFSWKDKKFSVRLNKKSNEF